MISEIVNRIAKQLPRCHNRFLHGKFQAPGPGSEFGGDMVAGAAGGENTKVRLFFLFQYTQSCWDLRRASVGLLI